MEYFLAIVTFQLDSNHEVSTDYRLIKALTREEASAKLVEEYKNNFYYSINVTVTI